jgi:hypothetical protein
MKKSDLAVALVFCAVSLPVGMAQTVESPGTSLGIASVPNLRDVGGYTAATVRWCGVALPIARTN